MAFGEKVTFKRGPTLDGNNNPIPGSGEVVAEECIVEWLGSADVTDLTRNGITDQARIFLTIRPDGEIRTSDTAMVRGQPFRVEGIADDWIDPEEPEFGGLVVTVKRGQG
ncbi:hypothetical protein [Prescottella equi]|uniref:hypothetical protein n=1 Tax=Rhodococcus hoagii TaxID=43767 RepID=UPI0007CD938A|nr:hypothetical protein [Prescottella equi]ORL01562.1 hypothetical protein A6F56_04380 [Prescottella equi]